VFDWAKKKAGYGASRESRSERRARNNLGIITIGSDPEPVVRSKSLDLYDSYYDNTQYDKLPSWDEATDRKGSYIEVRRRQPRFKVAFAKNLAQRVASKLVGDSVFPIFKVEENPDDTEFFRAVVRESKLKAFLLEPIRREINTGSVFIRFYLVAGTIKLKWYNSKHCYPTFQENGELEAVTIKYIFDSKDEFNEFGDPKKKWYRLDLTTTSEILYDNPDYEEGKDPEFVEVDRVDHGMGFVQGEWLRTCEQHDSPDGYGLVGDLMSFIDELCYSLSQSSQAVGYNQDPQLIFNKMDEDEIQNLIRSATKSWNVGREGEAKFLESNLGGVERAMELRDKVRMNIADISRVVLLDPEKIVGSAQSAKAMEVLHGPLKDLIDELRMVIEEHIKKLVLKMGLAILMASKQGIDVPLMLPPGYLPASLDLQLEWPPIFQQTMLDLQQKVQVAVAASSGNIISRESALRWLAKDFNIDDVEAELARVAAQPVINPFGGF
jgi:hypothetical protein